MSVQTEVRCENLACLCEVDATTAACSEACASRESRDPQNVMCGCGHAHCREQIDAQLHGDAGRESVG